MKLFGGSTWLLLLAGCSAPRAEPSAEPLTRAEVRSIVREEVRAALAEQAHAALAVSNESLDRAREARTVEAARTELYELRAQLVQAQRTYTEESDKVRSLRDACDRAQKRYDEVRKADAK